MNTLILVSLLVGMILIAIIILLLININNRKEVISDLEFESSNKNKKIEELNDELAALSKYKVVQDADLEAQKILDSAQDKLNQAKIEKDIIISDAKKDADKIIDEATELVSDSYIEAEAINKESREKQRKAKEDYDLKISIATKQVADIINNANEKAKQIAGNAYYIAQNVDKLENTAKAMTNIIKGYGDEYLKPTQSLLDDLAEEFGFTEAGQKLLAAREYSKQLVKNNAAGDCDYVEANRRNTAINFVIDAFNGKVDSILTLIKKDNYGILEEKIRNSYSLVNHLGEPFRNAHIKEIYLDARLDELKWAVTVNELKLKDREEQRRIKDEMREEERARREYEKAMKEAAKDEDTIRKAMEKAQKAIEQATEAQKAKYEAQLMELNQKLKEAEDKSQRALSMAQQTKSGHVYIISNIGSFGENVYKIGMTRRLEPLDRVRELGDASVPFPFDVHAMIYSENAPELETELHKFFVENQVNKVNPRKEFFRVPISEIKSEIESRNIEVKWTLTSLASEYRETISIEKAIANGAKKEELIKYSETIHDTDDE